MTANSRLVACAASSSDWELQLDINILIFSLDPTRACGAYTCMRRSRRRGQLWPIGQISLISEHRQISYDRFADNLVPSTFCCSLTLLLLFVSLFSILRLSQPRQAQRPWHGPGWRRAISISSKEQEHKILTRLPDAKILPCNIFGAGVILHR